MNSIAFSRLIRRMERHGVMIDLPYLDVLDIKLKESLIKVTKELDELVKPYVTSLNYNSSLQLKKLFFETLGYKLPEGMKTPSGEASTGIEALKHIVKTYDCKIAAKLMEHRAQTKLWATYVVGLKRMQRQGIIHAGFNQTGTVTGRLSSSKPNAQNIPRSNETEFDIRRLFVARPGHAFIIADYSQVELRLMAHFSKSVAMVDNYKVGGDIYKTVAAQIGSTRQEAKAVVLGINYGRTAYGLSKGLKITEEAAQTFIDGYFKVFPEVQKFLEDTANNLTKRPYVRTLAGRYRRFPDYLKALQRGQDSYAWRMERQAGNAIVQASAADVMKLAMIKLEQELDQVEGRMLITVHDEIIVECPLVKAEACSELVKRCMETCVDVDVTLTIEPKITSYWEK